MTIHKHCRGINTNGSLDVDDYYTKSQINSQMNTKADKSVTADTSLSNLSSAGQMVIDSQNGTISNCILDIPQNIKLMLENNVLTLKAGSTVVGTGSDTYSTYTFTSDLVRNNFSLNEDGQFMLVCSSTYFTWWKLSNIGSGSTLPADNSTYNKFFLTTDKRIYSWSTDHWAILYVYYPIAIIERDSNNVVHFAKDSNGNDMIFNGACFVGHHAVVYPNVKALLPSGINVDGSLASRSIRTQSLQIIELGTDSNRSLCFAGSENISNTRFLSVKNTSELTQLFIYQYCEETNSVWLWDNNTWDSNKGRLQFITYIYNGTTVTNFTIRQPVRTATVEMLNKVTAYRGTYDSSIQYYEGNIVKYSNEFYEALQDNINITPNNTANWSKLTNDRTVKYVEKSDDVEYPIGLTSSNASGSSYNGFMNFTTQNKPTINASTGVITVPGGIIGKTETVGDNSTKYATTAFVNRYLASITGYDATKTQTLKNVSGTLTWVDD